MDIPYFGFQRYLDADVELPAERVLALTEEVVFHLNGLINKLKKVYLVENMIESLKFAAGEFLLHNSNGALST